MKYGLHSKQLESNALRIYHAMITQRFMIISGAKRNIAAWDHATKVLKSQFLTSLTITQSSLKQFLQRNKSTLLKQLSEKDLNNS